MAYNRPHDPDALPRYANLPFRPRAALVRHKLAPLKAEHDQELAFLLTHPVMLQICRAGRCKMTFQLHLARVHTSTEYNSNCLVQKPGSAPPTHPAPPQQSRYERKPPPPLPRDQYAHHPPQPHPQAQAARQQHHPANNYGHSPPPTTSQQRPPVQNHPAPSSRPPPSPAPGSDSSGNADPTLLPLFRAVDKDGAHFQLSYTQ